MIPNAFTVASFAEDTWRLRALLLLREDGWDKERVLDLVHCLFERWRGRDILSTEAPELT
ncbi:hypothetical protein [Segniliparus rugosus]|uniref:Uncharacterized protein n=1 Tax=Segniliparus rugosus (strain ATCC BAA-974 / DSM 45345 / CCUG 50838 / CIP 108380 / JCM 13579 / CDC 945) TaxID=679197 RepID=E5XPX7_SEGRC|nr:hypothetical protein [Segniliparus rugosus]EFV13594.1 hypothetical protein HMPREF9336_01549 [Segniliparus rugosus ATCC BAA-974]